MHKNTSSITNSNYSLHSFELQIIFTAVQHLFQIFMPVTFYKWNTHTAYQEKINSHRKRVLNIKSIYITRFITHHA